MRLYEDRVNRDVLKYSLANMVIEQWNELPEKGISAINMNSFTNKFDKCLRKK
jgi:hypothetical protein